MKNTIVRIAIFALTLVLMTSISVTAFAAPVEPIQDADTANLNIATGNNARQYNVYKVPLYNQQFYDDVPYGRYGTVASHGCGITCVAMVATYWTNTIYTPDKLAEQFGHYNTAKGSYWTLFEKSAEELGVGFDKQTYKWDEAKAALENGQVVICIQSAGLFTKGGHFIILTGINDEGKVMVNDPNGDNWTKNEELIEGFKNGFTEQQIKKDALAYFIYEVKPEAT